VSSCNAFGDDPIAVLPCKCGYQWREGALPEEVCSHGGGEYVVVCPRCKASGDLKAMPRWAVEAWNASLRTADPEDWGAVPYTDFDRKQAAEEIGLMVQRILNLAPVAGIYVGINIRAACDSDGAEGGDANAAPVPQDCQARPEGIAQ
jgi:hypothetical protein